MTINLRAWQAQAIANYHQALARQQKTVLWEATPGSGKTNVALWVCNHQLRELKRERVIVVVPTSHLKIQWMAAAARFNIQLDSHFSDQRDWASDFQGVVVTYQQIGNHPKKFHRLAQGAVVILDEIHHAADGLTWGDALREAFADAAFILCLSGTAFRSDNSTIPFIKYQDDMSVPDYVYPYGQAIEDGVCRSVAFFTYGGEMAWMQDGEVIESKFSDALIGSYAGHRLRAALDPQSGWLKTLLEDAHEMLVETRREHPDAAGLLVAADQEHARELADLLQQISHTKPTIVLSDDPHSSRKIKKFADSKHEWIVACNMVSEGVDIPRLRVGVYATTITTKMYFRQFLGRIVRMTPAPQGVQVAYCYMPADIRLRVQAEQIEREQRHILSARVNLDAEPEEKVELAPRERTNDWQSLESRNSGVEAVIVNGGQLSFWHNPAAVSQPSQVKQAVERHVAERVATMTKSEAKTELTRQVKVLVAKYHHQSAMPYPQIHAYLNQKQSVSSQSYCTEEQLSRRIEILQKLLK